MAQLSMNETTTFRWSFEEDVAQYAAAGIPAIGIWRQKLSDCGLSKARDLLHQSGLKVSHLFWAGGFTGSDGRSYHESIEDAAEALRTAAELDCRTLVVYTGPRAGHTSNHARRLVAGALSLLAAEAGECGVTLAIEPMHPGCADQWTFLTTLDDTLALLDTVASPHVKMVLDTYHLGQESGMIDRLVAILPQVAIVQLGDARRPPEGEQNRCWLGEGGVPLVEITAALKAGGYDGYYDVELLGEELEVADYLSLLRHAKTAFATLVGPVHEEGGERRVEKEEGPA
jgi:sugar phosphate isomerase/epimerase